MKLSDRALNKIREKHPVRNAVEAVCPQVEEAMEVNASLNAIFLELEKDGKPVGAGYSNFYAAVKYLRQHQRAQKSPNEALQEVPADLGPVDKLIGPEARSSDVYEAEIAS